MAVGHPLDLARPSAAAVTPRPRPRPLRTAAIGWLTRFALAMAVAASTSAAGCGDDGGSGGGPDGGMPLNTLRVVDPPGESIGLPYHGKVTLGVAYTDPMGRPITGATVSFAIVAGATESDGGATISASSAETDAGGIASIDLVAGAAEVNFRVQASAPAASPALFYLAVSESGFTNLTATPAHLGFRAAQSLSHIEVRLYRDDELRCADFDPDDPPASVFPPRPLESFDDAAVYKNLTAGQGFTLVGWASLADDSPRVAVGCVELDGAVVTAGRSIRVPLVLTDRAPALPATLELAALFDARPLATVTTLPGADPWRVLGCPLGRAQLLIDCALDAEAPDGALDCAVSGQSPLVDAAEARRDPADPQSGCRPTGSSLDAAVSSALGAPWPAGGAPLDALLAARAAPMTSFALGSSLEATPTGSVHDQLERLSVTAGGQTYAADLIDSDRPIVRQLSPAAVDPLRGRVTLAPHAFTLRYGRFARDAFANLGLLPAGLDGRAADLGSALYDSVHDGPSSGCPAFSQVVCGALGQAQTCLAGPCGDAEVALDGRLEAWWRALDASGLDFTLGGSAAVVDDDGDLVIEELEGGSFTAGMGVAGGGATVQLTGTFAGTAAEALGVARRGQAGASASIQAAASSFPRGPVPSATSARSSSPTTSIWIWR